HDAGIRNLPGIKPTWNYFSWLYYGYLRKMQATQSMKEVVQQKWNKRPLIISGPCSAETEEQVVETVQRLAATGKVDMVRAGIWKPRTRPGSFEGIGMKGL